ncbi:hypothetical protein BBK36DRAFT_4451 [Trichoderma citrinoviride]|uniref:Uncharacterized protein n=1 Tax=Trichoderma citrinoviride TaxID=58853 RepID=A0A2T4BA49_9HYPO|nr:hypothetical protein BBK36DRAFT_4451 [Trichoderma citrinoviride]PTB66196.1 hypothetical protein BBK36DRAFT_4451 [Trichoderma citrinoviride]
MDPPAWYCRLVNLSQKREIEEDDFDEDISELRESDAPDEFSDGESIQRCECPSSDMLDCECDAEDAAPERAMDDGAESGRSYQGSDADYYYELKERRIERKIDLRDEKERAEERRRLFRELDSEQEREVREAYEAMLEEQKKGDAPRPRLASLSRAVFHLFSVDHIDYCYDYDHYLGTRYVEFYCLDEKGQTISHDDLKVKISGHVYLNSSTDCDFLSFVQPKRAGIKKRQFPVRGQDHAPVFQFISSKYLIMTVRSDAKMVSGDIQQLGVTDVPKELKFFGICMEREERKAYFEKTSGRFRRLG